jgi:hypothetical protein
VEKGLNGGQEFRPRSIEGWWFEMTMHLTAVWALGFGLGIEAWMSATEGADGLIGETM